MVKRGDMLSVEDVLEILAIDLIGIVPDDESIIVTTNRGAPAAMDNHTQAGQAYRNIAARLLGQDVPLMVLKDNNSFFQRLSKLIRPSN
jgi:septum site-determining protein MinD